jgi:DNA-binding GntR family transcriptional regulator
MVRPPIASNDEAMLALEPQPTIVEQAYRAILEAICEGRLEPGERLTQESVAAKLSVSRQPVGQALLLLRQQKFLVEAGRRGLMVAPLDRDFMRQIYELRLALEPMAASLAAQRAPQEARERGEPIVAQGRRAARDGDMAELIRSDMAFHMLIYELSGNTLFVDTMGQLWNHLRRAMREVLQHRDIRDTIWNEHERILRGLASGNGEEAARAAREHLLHAVQNVHIVVPAAD